MKKLLLILCLGAGLVLPAPARADTAINVFACEPEWEALAKEIGGAYVETVSATHAKQDPHHIRARPSLIARMRKADIVVCSGAGLEIGWLPLLLQKAGNADVQPGSPYSIMAAEHVRVLDKPAVVDRSMGDVHPEGNPHVHLNPRNVLKIADVLAQRLAQRDPAHAEAYRARHDDFTRRWKDAIRRWESKAAPLKGKSVITHHKAWTYLLDWLDLKLLNTLEPKPGIPPNTGHLETLLQQVKGTPVLAILRTPYAPDDASAWLSGKSGIPAIVLPYTIGGTEGTDDLFSLYDETLRRLTGGQNGQ